MDSVDATLYPQIHCHRIGPHAVDRHMSENIGPGKHIARRVRRHFELYRSICKERREVTWKILFLFRNSPGFDILTIA